MSVVGQGNQNIVWNVSRETSAGSQQHQWRRVAWGSRLPPCWPEVVPQSPASWGDECGHFQPRRLDRQTTHRGAIARARCNPISGASPQRSVRSVDSCTGDRYSGCMQRSCMSEHLLGNRDRREWATRQLGGSVVRAITRQPKPMQSCTSVHTVATSIRGCELGDRATGLRRRRVTVCTTAAQTVGDKAVLHRQLPKFVVTPLLIDESRPTSPGLFPRLT